MSSATKFQLSDASFKSLKMSIADITPTISPALSTTTTPEMSLETISLTTFDTGALMFTLMTLLVIISFTFMATQLGLDVVVFKG